MALFLACSPVWDVWIEHGSTLDRLVFGLAEERRPLFTAPRPLTIDRVMVLTCEGGDTLWAVDYEPDRYRLQRDTGAGSWAKIAPRTRSDLPYGFEFGHGYLVLHAAEPLRPGVCYVGHVGSSPGNGYVEFRGRVDGKVIELKTD